MSSFSPGPWPAPPGPEARQRFQRHVQETGYPERFLGVVTNRKPPTDGTAKYVCDFYADPKKRNGERVPCPLCSPKHPKYNDGGLVWADGYLFVVGHQCAAKHFDAKRYQRMRADAQFGKRLDEADLSLIQHFGAVHMLRAHISVLRTIAHQIENQRNRLRGEIPELAKRLLRSARDHEGKMVVLVDPPEGLAVADVSRTARSMDRVRPIGNFMGLTLIADPKLDLLRKLEDIEGSLPLSKINADAMEAHLRTLPDSQRILLWQGLSGAPLKLRKLEGAMREAASFLSIENLRAMMTWSAQPKAQIIFDVYQDSATRFELRYASEWTYITAGNLYVPACPVADFM